MVILYTPTCPVCGAEVSDILKQSRDSGGYYYCCPPLSAHRGNRLTFDLEKFEDVLLPTNVEFVSFAESKSKDKTVFSRGKNVFFFDELSIINNGKYLGRKSKYDMAPISNKLLNIASNIATKMVFDQAQEFQSLDQTAHLKRMAAIVNNAIGSLAFF
jgi:hypothetical protein